MTGTLKVALVTGAGRGIGRAVALALAKENYAVVLAGRGKEALEKVEAEIVTAGGAGLAVPTDIGNPEAVATLFAVVKSRFGRLDLLFNNAGSFGPAKLLEEISYESWQEMLAVNLTGAFLCTQEAFRLMKDQTPRGGRIINNGSISAHVPRPNSAPYTATKHAITGLTKSTSLDGRKYDIACGQIDIGNAATEMTAQMTVGVLQANLTRAAEPVMDVEHVARAVIYMASLPPEANVLFLTVTATKMPYVGRG
jgi:NAD(P)-dependent dehydrogenase (short-subunit alcohol dehydrogenase family)